jgi:4-amino-4-deoxy-L-arabinose transferase-like glycosyltransferase
MPTSSRALWALTFILILAFAARLLQLQTQSIWFDEGWSAYAAQQPTLPVAAGADATNPPLYYMLLNLAVRGFGDSPFALRLFSLFVGLLAIPLTYQLARRLFNPRAGLYAAMLAAFSPLLWWASQEARMYTLLALLVVICALAWHTLLTKPTRAAWLALWAAELALLYAHNTGPVVALWLNAVTLLAWITRRSLRRPDWRLWIAGQVAVAALWSPYFANRFLLLGEANSAVNHAPTLSLTLLSSIWAAFWAGNWEIIRVIITRSSLLTLYPTDADRPVIIGLSYMTLLVALAVIAWRRTNARWLVAHVVILIGALLLGLGLLGNELHGRYLVMVVPLLTAVIGAGIARLRPLPLRWGLTSIFLAVFLVSVSIAQNPLYGHDDTRGMVQYYADHLTANDTVLAWSYADRYDLAYYWPRMNVQARRVTLPEGADLDAIAPLLPRTGDVAVNVWYTQRADYRGMLNCVLSHGTTNEPELFTTYGMTDLLYRQPSLDLPQMQPLDLDFGVARVNAAGIIPDFTADRALCLPVQITLSQPVASDLKALLVVQNNLGWEITRADAVFAQADQRTTSQLAPGQTLTAYPLVRLPYGAPPGDYRIYLRLYDETDHPSGYEPQSPTVERHGRDVLLGVWSAPRGADWTQVRRETGLVDITLSLVDDLTLVGVSNVPANRINVHNGDVVRLTFLWQGTGELPTLKLAPDVEAVQWGAVHWAYVEVPPTTTQRDVDITLDWREIRIPPDVEGWVTLYYLGSPVARYNVEVIPIVTEPPAFDTSVGIDIPGVGTLAGYSLAGDTANLGEPLPLTLVWRAGDTQSEASYTVFAQLIDTDGVLIGQSDQIPAAGERPTTGWRAGEYIVDAHELTFNDAAHPGEATLIVGMYDAATGERVLLADDSDAISLPGTVTVR